MLNNMFQGIFDTEMTTVIAVPDFLLCVGCALVIGLILAGAYMYGTRYTKSFVATLAVLPAIVCVVIMMVNGNVGAGVAVAGAFSLVRFRSVPGSAKEIGAIFLAMGTGLVAGMGYLGYAFLVAVILGGVTLLYNKVDFGAGKKAALYKTLHITIPENLDYTGVFDKILKQYTKTYEVVQVKTTNMGSLFKLTYNIIGGMHMKRKVVLAFLLTGALVLSGCSKTNSSNETSSGSTSTDSSAQGIDVSNMFSDRDKEIGYDEENNTVIKLSDDSTTCDSDAVQISGNTVTIIDEGTYILSGTLTDGMVIVDAEDTDKVQLVLNGVDITSAESAAIYVREADKVFITTASDSKNTLTNGGTYTAIDDNNIDAAIFQNQI